MRCTILFTGILVLFSWSAMAQQDKIGAMVGNVTGLVTHDDGALVKP